MLAVRKFSLTFLPRTVVPDTALLPLYSIATAWHGGSTAVVLFLLHFSFFRGGMPDSLLSLSFSPVLSTRPNEKQRRICIAKDSLLK